ncbi:MAG: Lrp/AsnC family transcriptional regulator [Firmicutes bacterium]|nr:Lrp/AsnC family transcriptional regulator [Bacillota bacterium]
MDEIDYRLINDLISDSRTSYAELGRRYNLSRVAIRDRINHLIETGVIEKFTIVVNPEKLGKHVSAFFEVDVEPHKLNEVATALAEHDAVLSIYLMTGPSTLHVHALLEDNQSLERFVHESIYSLPGVTRVESHLVLTRYKNRRGGLRI